MAAPLPVILALLLQNSLSAPPASPPDDQVVEPRWERRPSAQSVARALQQVGARGGGAAIMRCIVTVEGGMRDCVVVGERPAGKNLGKALLALAPYFKLRPAIRNGKPVEGVPITIPVVFDVVR